MRLATCCQLYCVLDVPLQTLQIERHSQLLDLRFSRLQVCQSVRWRHNITIFPHPSHLEDTRLLVQHQSPSQADIPRHASATSGDFPAVDHHTYYKQLQLNPLAPSVDFGRHLRGAVKGDSPEPDRLAARIDLLVSPFSLA